MLYRCIRCGEGFRTIQDWERHQQTVHKNAKEEDDARDLLQLYGEYNTYLDETVNNEARKPALVPSDHDMFLNIHKGPLPKHLFV